MWASPALRPDPGPAALGAPAGPTQPWEFRNLSDTDSGKGFPFLVKVSIYRPGENSHRISRRKSPAPARLESPPNQPLCLLNLFSLFPQFPPFWNGMEPPPRSLCGRGKTASTRAEGPPLPRPRALPCNPASSPLPPAAAAVRLQTRSITEMAPSRGSAALAVWDSGSGGCLFPPACVAFCFVFPA